MTSARKQQVPSKGRNLSEGPPGPSKSDLPQLASLCDKLDRGGGPNFLDVMLVLAEVVDFYTNPDQNEPDRVLENCKMSHNNCRFCS